MSKYTPILFSTPMVQAIVNNRKTMTRRVVKSKTALEWLEPEMFTPAYVANPENNLCPYGKPGDVLWVRETTLEDTTNEMDWFHVYKADHPDYPTGSSKWRPSIFMPKTVCRIFLEVTDVKVERLQDISEEDAKAEGAPSLECYEDCSSKDCNGCTWEFYKNGFKTLWHSINGAESWDANPFVWAISFKRIDKPENFI